ncbi:MAG: conjugative transposon protein TraM [Agriterribacter sp.]
MKIRKLLWDPKNKVFVLAPLFFIPLITLLLWSIGVLGTINKEDHPVVLRPGLNTHFPAPVAGKDSSWNKLNFYDQADRAAQKLAMMDKIDPYRFSFLNNSDDNEDSLINLALTAKTASKMKSTGNNLGVDENELQIYKKISVLNSQIEGRSIPIVKEALSENDSTAFENASVANLRAMMKSIQTDSSGSKDISQLNAMLEKILEIQHPDRVKKKDIEQSSSNSFYNTVASGNIDEVNSILKQLSGYASNRFFTLQNVTEDTISHLSTIAAVIHDDQSVTSGGAVRLRTLQAIWINGSHVPANHILYGKSHLAGDRLQIKISSVQLGGIIIPVQLSVYDLDGGEGIYVPDAITSEVVNTTVNQSAQDLSSLNLLDQSLGAQMATAGLQAAQRLVSKHTRKMRVYIKSGYSILLKDESQKKIK